MKIDIKVTFDSGRAFFNSLQLNEELLKNAVDPLCLVDYDMTTVVNKVLKEIYDHIIKSIKP